MTKEEKILQRQLHIINNSFYGKTNINNFKNRTKILINKQQEYENKEI